MIAAMDLSPANCQRLADELRDTKLGDALLRPALTGLAPLDAIAYEQRRADLRERGLLDENNKLTRLGRRVQGCI